MAQLQKITPCLWFDHQAKEAAEYYCSLFKDSRITSSSEIVTEFDLEGYHFMALNGGPKFNFTEATSFVIYCEDQEEVDHFWNHFVGDGGEESLCSWCRDKYGLSWQVIPKRFIEMMTTGTPDQVRRVTDAMLQMRKMIVEDFEKAFRG